MGRLLTPQQLVEEFNLPSVSTVRTLRAQGLPTIKLGAARMIDYDDMVEFIENKKERPPLKLKPQSQRTGHRDIDEQSRRVREHLLKLAGGKEVKPHGLK